MQVDWWAFGVMIYEMLTGYQPFTDEDPQILLKKIACCNVVLPCFLENKAKKLISGFL
jgi:serine/threonine protein kinase